MLSFSGDWSRPLDASVHQTPPAGFLNVLAAVLRSVDRLPLRAVPFPSFCALIIKSVGLAGNGEDHVEFARLSLCRLARAGERVLCKCGVFRRGTTSNYSTYGGGGVGFEFSVRALG